MKLPANLLALDATTSGGFVPYRDGEGRIRLLDLYPTSKPSPLSRKLQKHALAALEAGQQVTSEAEYRVWYVAHMDPLFALVSQAKFGMGACSGDEGQQWAEIADAITRVVHRPGWRVE